MIQQKLLEIQRRSIALKKDADNPFFKSKYITLDAIISQYNPILTELRIVAYHHTKDNKLITVLYDTENKTQVESEFNIYNTDPQKQGSEVTYWKRYNLWQLLNIQTDTDDDGNLASSSGNTKEYYPKSQQKNWLNYESALEIIKAGNDTPESFWKIVKEDGYDLSSYAKKAIADFFNTWELKKNLFFKQAR